LLPQRRPVRIIKIETRVAGDELGVIQHVNQRSGCGDNRRLSGGEFAEQPAKIGVFSSVQLIRINSAFRIFSKISASLPWQP
jgi:hypothetical protein